MKKTARFLLPTLLLTCLLAFAACSDEKTIETPAGKVEYKETDHGVKVTSKDGSVTMQGNDKGGYVKIKDQDGQDVEMTYASEKLVSGFPADIPIYKPAKIATSQLLDGKNAVATLTTGDSPEDVIKFFKAELPKKGWTVENEMSMGSIAVLQGRKDGMSLTVQMTKQGDETGITIASAKDE